MISELVLSKSNRKVEVTITGGDDSNIFITIPRIKNEFIHFLKGEELLLNYYTEEKIYHFYAAFDQIKEFHGKLLYKLNVKSLLHSINYRKQLRQNVEIPCMIFSDTKNHFSTILDINDDGMKIETNFPVTDPKIVIFYEKNNENWMSGKVVWSKNLEGFYHHGIKLDA